MFSFKSMSSLTVLLFLPTVLCQESRAVKTLCEDTYIHSADRLPNNTYRVYRDDLFWELVGLPERVAIVNGPYKIWFKNMAPTTRDTAIFTVVGGGIDGFTYKYTGERFWVWNKKGVQRSGEAKGWKWSGFPKGGFTAAYSDGDMNNKGYPMLVAFSGIRVYYFNTNAEVFRRIGNESGDINGAFGEKFPPDLTAAMAYKSGDSDKYHVYLFKRKQHCYRPFIGEDDCKEWRSNSELFGCPNVDPPEPENAKQPEISNETKNPIKDQQEEIGHVKGAEEEKGKETVKEEVKDGAHNLWPNHNSFLLFFAIILIKNIFH